MHAGPTAIPSFSMSARLAFLGFAIDCPSSWLMPCLAGPGWFYPGMSRERASTASNRSSFAAALASVWARAAILRYQEK